MDVQSLPYPTGLPDMDNPMRIGWPVSPNFRQERLSVVRLVKCDSSGIDRAPASIVSSVSSAMEPLRPGTSRSGTSLSPWRVLTRFGDSASLLDPLEQPGGSEHDNYFPQNAACFGKARHNVKSLHQRRTAQFATTSDWLNWRGPGVVS